MLNNPHLCDMSLAHKLIEWYKDNGRDLPWRHTQNPYVIWLSEIILQQTRVEQGMPYFYRFLDSFPTISDFAEADEEHILRLWQGLGYYSRARNMHKAAKYICDDLNGIFPSIYVELLKLPGVGEYTAAAISSFSINEDRAVLDGNVFRVLSRYFGINEPINTGAGKKLFLSLANEVLIEGKAGVYNQAIMDFGATVCKPKAPDCANCVLQLECIALKNGTIGELPVKIKGKASRNRYFHYFIIEDGTHILMSKRGDKDVWANLYEFPLIETEEDIDINGLVEHSDYQKYFGGIAVQPIGNMVKHVLSHQNIYAKFYRIVDFHLISEKKESWNYHLLEKLDKLAKHKLVFSFINEFVLTN